MRAFMNVYMWCIGEDDDANPSDDAVTVIDVVDAHRLKEIELDKKAFMGYIKGKKNAFSLLGIEYLKKIKGKLEESGKSDRVAGF